MSSFLTNERGWYLPIEFQVGMVFLAVINILSSLFGTVANCLIIIAYCQNRRLRENVQNFIFLALAITDLSVTAFVQPSYAVSTIAALFGPKWGTFRQIILISSFVCIDLSAVTIIILSLQTLLTLVYPYQEKKFITKQRLKIITFSSWFLILDVGILTFFLDTAWTAGLCSFIIGVLTIFSAVFAWIWTYELVIKHRNAIKRTQVPLSNKITAKRKILKSTWTAILIISSLLVCYVITQTFLVYYIKNNDWGVGNNGYFLLWCFGMTLTYTNSLVNPCLVFYRNSCFRKTVRNICCRN